MSSIHHLAVLTPDHAVGAPAPVPNGREPRRAAFCPQRGAFDPMRHAHFGRRKQDDVAAVWGVVTRDVARGAIVAENGRRFNLIFAYVSRQAPFSNGALRVK